EEFIDEIEMEISRSRLWHKIYILVHLLLTVSTLLALTLPLAACETTKGGLTEVSLERLDDSKISRGGNCFNLEMTCPSERFKEWRTAEGETMCSCLHERQD